MQLVEEAIDGCWIGHRARTAMGDSGIGSVYAPPSEDHGSAFTTRRKHVETVVDIEYRPEVKFSHSHLIGTDCLQGWSLKCEKGGIRRVLMNLFGNSLKFTSVRVKTWSKCRFLVLLMLFIFRMDMYMFYYVNYLVEIMILRTKSESNLRYLTQER